MPGWTWGERAAAPYDLAVDARVRVAYQLDRAAVSAADAEWLAGLADAPRRDRDDALRRLRADAALADDDRDRLHLIGMGLAVLGRSDEAVSVFVRASELDPTTTVDAVNAAVALVHTGDIERARLWLAPVAQGNDDLSDVAREFIAELDRAQELLDRHDEPAGQLGSTAVDPADLLQEVTGGGPQAQSALNTLRQLVARQPDNEYYRHTLMFGLMANSHHAEAMTQAEMLASRPDGTHERHFNLAQAFWFAGERVRAHEHFAMAHELAGTDEERQDVVSMLEYLREQDEYVDED